jgi:predicted nucleotidyltransferase component of viral defense system
MDNAIKTMLQRYNFKSSEDYENAVKEIIQEIALLGLWRAKFFEKAAFYGGTALRLLYGLDRFSEDIDFSLLEPDKAFRINDYISALINELSSFGFIVEVERKDKTFDTNIESAFIKAGTLKSLITVETPSQYLKNRSSARVLKVKIEVDTDPPSGFETEAKYLLNPIPFSVNTYKIPYLFAGKMHAILCRKWKTRVKGRDWYDFVWYVGSNSKLNLKHLENRMKQTGHLAKNDTLSKELFLNMLYKQTDKVEFEKAKNDVLPFLKDPDAVSVWSRSFFSEVIKRIQYH